MALKEGGNVRKRKGRGGALGSGQWAVGTGQWAVGSGHGAVSSGHGAVGTEHWAVGSDGKATQNCNILPITSHLEHYIFIIYH